MAWGYVDMPPLTALQARLAEMLFGLSPAGVRIFSFLAAGVNVGLAGLLAWQLGGRRITQLLAMTAVLAAPMRLYDLRHTWVTRAAMSGIDLVTLAAMLGHSRIQMVLRYAHPTQEHQTKSMEQLERFNAEQQIAAFEKQSAMTQ
jgi:4-amino-4-deoxy-L-arabinose transferase-like glycosyltransferase